MGILLYGLPGCGKTSIIKAILKETGRHGICLKLRETTTETQCDNLFKDENIVVVNPTTNIMSSVIIPLDKRVYILEDVDCLT